MGPGSRGGPRPLHDALALFQAGRMAEAEAALRACLALEPDRADALEMLGTALSAQGRLDEALDALGRALALRPSAASIHHNRAHVLHALGRQGEAREALQQAVALKPDLHASWNLLGGVLLAEGDTAAAEKAYRRAIALRPEQPETHYNLGVLFQQSGRVQEAVACYRRALALRPQFAQAHNNLANALKQQGRAAEALTHYEQAARAEPRLADAQANLGAALREAGRLDEAIAVLERALALAPRSWVVQDNLGTAYFERSRFAEAAECHRRALELRADFHEARNNLGNALAAMGREEEAMACYRAVIRAVPHHAGAHSNLGLILQERGEVDAAIAAYERALAAQPDHADAINNLGYLLQEQGRREDAMALYRRAMQASPQAARPAYNLGLAHLCRFEFAQGWRLCEQRYYTTPPVAALRALAIPALGADDLGKGHRIAIWKEQGVGDQLLYATLLPELAARGEEFAVEVDRRLVPAFARAHPGWNVVSPEHSEAAFAQCDRHIAIASLGGLLRPSLASFDRQPQALLAADPVRAAAFRARLAQDGCRLVGISWKSFQPAARRYVQRKKSAPLDAFAALASRGTVRLLDLQYGDTRAEREAFAAAGGALAHLDDLDLFNDLDGVLAAIAACDCVVTTSNVTAHLAGVLGKPTLLLYLGDNPPFHYWVPREDGRCLWYPSMRVVTGRDMDSWEKALERAAQLMEG